MARPFLRTADGVWTSLDEFEHSLLSRVLDEVARMLLDDSPVEDDPLARMVGLSPGAAVPQDPALARLLPPASVDDEAAALEFRRLTERDLRTGKRENLAVAAQTMARAREGQPGAEHTELVLSDAEAQAWLLALTDVRLVLGERLGLRTDEDADTLMAMLAGADPDDPRAYLAAVYDFLTGYQEMLATVLLAALPDAPGQDDPDGQI